MESATEQMLGELKERTGVCVTPYPVDGAEAFEAEVLGKRCTFWIGGGHGGQTVELVRFLIENSEHAALPGREESLKNILLGEGSGWYVYRFMSKYNLVDGECFAINVEEGKRLAETVAHISGCLSESGDCVIRMDDNHCAVVRFGCKDQSPIDFARFLSQSLYEEIGVKASMGVGGTVKSFAEIAKSYHQAATSVRMSSVFHSKGEVHSYREYLLVKMLEDLPEAKLREYLEQFSLEEAADVLEDEEMLETAEEFLENSLNISETSRNLFMHRNTLMYRLDKIERATGLNIRKFSDAVSFRVITILYKLMQL